MAFIELTVKGPPPTMTTVNTAHILKWKAIPHGGAIIELTTIKDGEYDYLVVKEGTEEIMRLIRQYDSLSANADKPTEFTDAALGQL